MIKRILREKYNNFIIINKTCMIVFSFSFVSFPLESRATPKLVMELGFPYVEP